MSHLAEANLAALIESTEDFIWSVDLDYRLITFNRALSRDTEASYGVRPAAGMRLYDHFPPERAVLWPQFYERALKEGSFRTEYSPLSGRTLELTFNPIVIEGETTGISVFGKDISERKTAENALQDAEKKYRDIFDGAIEGMFQVSPEGIPLTVNHAHARILGYDSPQDLLSTAKDLSQDTWVDLEERARFIQQMAQQGFVQGFECRLKRKDGAIIWVSLNARNVHGADGQILYREGFMADITDHKQAVMQLRHNEKLYRTTFQQAPVGIIHTSFAGKILRCNARFAQFIGYPAGEVPGITFPQITAPEDIASTQEIIEQMQRGPINSACWEKRYIRKDGSLTWAKVTMSVQRDSEGRAQHLIVLVEDINALKAAEERLAEIQQALRSSEERYRIAFQTSIDAINISRLSDGAYIDCNQAFLDIAGYERQEVMGRTSLELGIWVDKRDRRKLMQMLLQSSICRGLEARFRKKNGEILWGQMSASIVEVDGTPCVLSITRDITQTRLAEEEIRNLAFYDPLTALPNRRLLLERLRQRAAACAPCEGSQALLFIDLDNFKMLNDTLGHRTGDLLLREVGRRIVACVREAGTVGRLGGDEFLVMLEGLSEAAPEAAIQAEATGEKILASLGQPYLLNSHECLSSASIGIALFGDRISSTDEIFQQADIALHQAKAAGRNTMRFFSPTMLSAVNARAEMEDDLRQAIKTNQFMLYYQPQVERSHLMGAEALIRWRHPSRGIVQPNEFIALAEETGLILPLGDWVLETACAQIASWAGRKQTADFAIAVNISTLQFRQPEFVEQVLAALERAGANPKNLKLELTESMLANNIEDIIAKMTELKSHGLRFSLDDFGTGYSSLAYLKRLPLDELKIDRAFGRDLLVDATSGAIAQTIISLGRAMGLSLVAEGVETEEQRGFLDALGCYAFQGYLLSRPLPLEEFEAFLLNFAESSVPLLGSWESYAREIGTGEPILSKWATSFAFQNENPRGKIALELPGWRKK
jgi:diguanylate cyclase (GGDEF)-like protein/PAS domain S-box-containing protein